MTMPSDKDERAPTPAAQIAGASALTESGWTVKAALDFYAAGKHFDVVEGRTRILDTGAVASDALKGADAAYAKMKGAPLPESGLMHQTVPAPQQPETVTTTTELHTFPGTVVTEDLMQHSQPTPPPRPGRPVMEEGNLSGWSVYVTSLERYTDQLEQLYGAACLQLQARGDKTVALSASGHPFDFRGYTTTNTSAAEPVSTRQFASDPLMAELPGIGGIDALKKE